MIFPPNDPTMSGIVGCTVLCRASLDFDYRNKQLRIGGSPATTATALPFQLEGGGPALAPDGTTIQVPASRARVTGVLEGTRHTFILDTGAEFVVVRTSILSSLTADGRGTLPSTVITAASQNGSTGTMARLRSLLVAGLEVDRIPGMSDTQFDTVLDAASQDAGETIDGSLGATFLREFDVTIDYPNRTAHFDRYTSRDHIIDWTVRIGIEVGLTPDLKHIGVAQVYPNTDAAKQGMAVGDVIAAIDGVTTSTDSDEIVVLDQLAGAVGTKHQINFGCPGCSGFQGTRTVAVDDLLPLP
jgi:hypothetical protein